MTELDPPDEAARDAVKKPDVLDDARAVFRECAVCAVKPGAPNLCYSCMSNRRSIEALRYSLELLQSSAREDVSRLNLLRVKDQGELEGLRRLLAESEAKLVEVSKRGAQDVGHMDKAVEHWKVQAEQARTRVAELTELLDRYRTVVFDLCGNTKLQFERQEGR